VYGASRDGGSDLYMKPADGVGSETPFQKSMSLKLPTDWTADGRVVFTTVTPGGTDVMVAPAAGGGQPAPIVNTSANEGSGKVSPNGRWLAYASNESGHNEVYVRALDGRGRWPISRNGGAQPRWRRDGKELFFVGDDANLMVAAVSETATSFSSAEPAALPIKVQPDVTGWRYSYDVAARGQRVIASVPVGRDQTPPIIVIPNWTSLVRK
jgi:hypothetical protein